MPQYAFPLEQLLEDQMDYMTAFGRGRADRAAGRPLIAHEDIPDGVMWDAYMDGYVSLKDGPINPCEREWLMEMNHG